MSEKRDPRSAPDAERAILGACFTSPLQLALARAIIRSEDLFVPAHRIVFDTMCSLVDSGTPVDLVTLTDALQKAETLERVTKTFALDELDFIGHPHVEAHARIVADHAEARRVRDITTKLWKLANDPAVNPASLRELAGSILRAPRNSKAQYLDEHMEQLQRELEAARDGAPIVKAYTTGIDRLDLAIGGLRAGDMTLIAGQTGHGKSALAMTLVLMLAMVETKPSLLVSMEMLENDLAIRATAFLTSMSQTRIRAAQVDKLGGEKLALEEIAELEHMRKQIKQRVRTIARGQVSLQDVRDTAIGMQASSGLSAILIDYLQLMEITGAEGTGTREREVATISRGLKSIAMDLGVPVVALSQLSRRAEDYDEPVPGLLRESGQIENDASAIVFVWPDNPPSDNTVRLFVSKSRFSPPCNFAVSFDRPHSKFGDLAEWSQ